MLNERLIVIALAILYGIVLNHCHKDNPLDNVPEVPQELELINDDFEAYTPGIEYRHAQIIEGKWYVVVQGSAANYFTVDDQFAFSGGQSLRLEKSLNSLDFSRAYSMEPAMQNNANSPVYITCYCYTSNSTSQPVIHIGNKGPATNSQATNIISIVANDGDNGRQNSIYTNSLVWTHRLATIPGGVYVPQVWHRFDIMVDTPNQAFSVTMDGLSQYVGYYKNPRRSQSVNYIALSVNPDGNNAKVWFDELRVWTTPSR